MTKKPKTESYRWTEDHEAALKEWMEYLGTPVAAQDAVREKTKCVRSSPEQIREELQGFKDRGVKPYKKGE